MISTRPRPVGRTTADLLHDLRESVGVQPGQTWIVHSSMKAIGLVVGGLATVVDALQQGVGAEGTLLMPVFSW